MCLSSLLAEWYWFAVPCVKAISLFSQTQLPFKNYSAHLSGLKVITWTNGSFSKADVLIRDIFKTLYLVSFVFF